MFDGVFEVMDLWRRQVALAGGFAALAPATGYVVATRLARMTTEPGGPTSDGAREAERMVTEKISAAFEGGMAASRVLSGVAFAPSPFAAAGMMVAAGEAALRPARRRVRANARRLSRGG